jgi:hypothetical protein
MASLLEPEDFEPHVGTAFRLSDGPEPTTLELLAVERSPRQAEHQRHPFSLLFAGAPGVVHEQRTYRLEHDAMGALDVFLSPKAPLPGDPRVRYEAVFG